MQDRQLAHSPNEPNYRFVARQEIRAAKLAYERAQRAFEQTRATLKQSQIVLEQSFKVLGSFSEQGQDGTQE
ncbi:hypothetical protein [Bradyrhizobium sp. B117]|uniref:hypothetical protein n=1 Tax=Bradyrhizobium sp. B117 TaxID=3140246 RepID=UPI0031832CB1